MSDKGALTLSIKAIVIIVIAVLVIALGIGFITTIFSKAGALPELVDVSLLPNQPSPDNPLVLSPEEVTVKSGESAQLLAAYYNTGNKAYFRVKTGVCIDSDGNTYQPGSVGLSSLIEKGKAVGFRITIYGTDTVTNTALGQGQYLCELVAFETTSAGGCAQFAGGVCPQRHRTQFTLNVD
ncbi:hypothetical protein D6789_03010 [Candidatus Woesearchaeota archaeon]|nr:MAG: hypothetical protein D6789_03010 [Candidatus Woesearchaeota archaeon]